MAKHPLNQSFSRCLVLLKTVTLFFYFRNFCFAVLQKFTNKFFSLWLYQEKGQIQIWLLLQDTIFFYMCFFLCLFCRRLFTQYFLRYVFFSFKWVRMSQIQAAEYLHPQYSGVHMGLKARGSIRCLRCNEVHIKEWKTATFLTEAITHQQYFWMLTCWEPHPKKRASVQ